MQCYDDGTAVDLPILQNETFSSKQCICFLCFDTLRGLLRGKLKCAPPRNSSNLHAVSLEEYPQFKMRSHRVNSIRSAKDCRLKSMDSLEQSVI